MASYVRYKELLLLSAYVAAIVEESSWVVFPVKTDNRFRR